MATRTSLPPIYPHNSITPASLPPINPYCVSIEVEPSYNDGFYDPQYTELMFTVKPRIFIKYLSSDERKSRILEGLTYNCEGLLYFPRRDDYSPAFCTKIRQNWLDKLDVPFEFDRGVAATRIREVACSMAKVLEPIYRVRNVFPIVLKITQKVELPESDFNAWCAWFDVKDERSREINYAREKRKKKMLNPLLVVEDDEDEEGRSSDSENNCPICLRSLLNAKRKNCSLPCSHTFHEECIMKWGVKNKNCPLCRFPF